MYKRQDGITASLQLIDDTLAIVHAVRHDRPRPLFGRRLYKVG